MTPQELEKHRALVKQRRDEYQRDWRKKNSDRYYALQRKRRAENPERTKAQSAKHRNPEKARQYAKEYAANNPEKIKARFKRYLDKHRAESYEKWSFSISRKMGCEFADRIRLLEIYKRAVELTKQTGVLWSVDHIIPLSFGGHHRPENVQLMPALINQIKSGNPFWICQDGIYKDWRSVPVEFWSEKFKSAYYSVVDFSDKNRMPFLIIA